MDDVFDDCFDEALRVLSPAGLDAYLAHARWLGKLGRGAEPLLVFLEIWPTVAAAAGQKRVASAGFALLTLVFIGSAIFGAYHAGVEWGFWPGPTDCTGNLSKASSMDDFMNQLATVKVVRCDAVAIRILGLSLAGWNAVISAALAMLGAMGARRCLAD